MMDVERSASLVSLVKMVSNQDGILNCWGSYFMEEKRPVFEYMVTFWVLTVVLH